MQRNHLAARRLSRGRRLLGGLLRLAPVLVSALALGACATGSRGMRDYASWANGRNPCDCSRNDMCDYAAVIKGVPPCPVFGECGVPCEPCAPPCPPPPCPPPPCAPTVGATRDFPPEARPGEAWCRVLIPAKYDTVVERVMTVCPCPQSIWVAPCMESKFHEVCVRPPCTQEIELPGVYKTETYCCEISPASTEQRPRPCTCEEQARGQCNCFDIVTIPPCTQVRTRQVCIQAPTRKTVYQPALYRTEATLCEKVPGHWQDVTTPGVYENVTRLVCREPERWEWQRNPTCTVPGADRIPMPTGPAAPPPGTTMPAPTPVAPPPDAMPPAPVQPR